MVDSLTNKNEFLCTFALPAEVVELVDTLDSKSNACKGVWVRVPPLVQKEASHFVELFLFKVHG